MQPDPMFDLSGRVAIVTGAGQNAGRGIALAGRGAHVVVNDLVPDRAQATVGAVAAAGGTAAAAVFDVTDLAAVQAAVSGIGPIDILVNNAGNGGATPMVPTPFAELDPSVWRGPIDVNLGGVLNSTHAVLGAMIERRWGRIITISSGAGTAGVGIGVAPYSAGKGGTVAFMRSLALEVAASGVTANSVALGLMDNVGTGGVTAAIARSIPTRRLGAPEDVGAICVYLASAEASWITGQTIGLNGGSMTS